jgi:hypothetical protein
MYAWPGSPGAATADLFTCAVTIELLSQENNPEKKDYPPPGTLPQVKNNTSHAKQPATPPGGSLSGRL